MIPAWILFIVLASVSAFKDSSVVTLPMNSERACRAAAETVMDAKVGSIHAYALCLPTGYGRSLMEKPELQQ